MRGGNSEQGSPVRGGDGSGEPAATARRRGALRVVSPAPRRAPTRPARRRGTPAIYRRRRVFAALVLLNLVELVGVITVGPGFWVSFAVTITLLASYTVHLRNRTLQERRRRRERAREAAWLAARQAEVRREQARRAAARREMQRRLAAQREALRRAALNADRGDLPAAASGDGSTATRRAAGSVFYRPGASGLRGRPYQAGRGS